MSLPRRRSVNRHIFSLAFKKGESFYSKNLYLRVFNTPCFDLEGLTVENRQTIEAVKEYNGLSSFSFVVSSKVAKRATVRNLLKRRAKYIVRKMIGTLKEGYICLFFFNKGVLGLDFKGLESEILFVLKKANLV